MFTVSVENQTLAGLFGGCHLSSIESLVEFKERYDWWNCKTRLVLDLPFCFDNDSSSRRTSNILSWPNHALEQPRHGIGSGTSISLVPVHRCSSKSGCHKFCRTIYVVIFSLLLSRIIGGFLRAWYAPAVIKAIPIARTIELSSGPILVCFTSLHGVPYMEDKQKSRGFNYIWPMRSIVTFITTTNWINKSLVMWCNLLAVKARATRAQTVSSVHVKLF